MAKLTLNKTLDAQSILHMWSDIVAESLVISMACIQPIYLDSTRYLNLTQAKYKFFVFCAGMCLAAALVICFLRLLTNRGSFKFKLAHLSFFDWAALCFALVTVLSAALSPFSGEAPVWIGMRERYDGALTQLLYVSIYFIISRWYVPRLRDLIVFGISSLIVGLIGILQFYGLDIFGLWPNHILNFHVENFYNIHFRSTLGNVDILSAYVCIALILCGFLYIGSSSKRRFLWFLASIFNFWLMELAGADSGRAGTVFAVLVSIPVVIEHKRYLGRFLLLSASWIFIYALQKMMYDVNILKAVKPYALIPFAVFAVALAVRGVMIVKCSHPPSLTEPARWKRGIFLVVLVTVFGLAVVEFFGSRIEDTGHLIYQAREIMHGNMHDEFGTYRGYIWRVALENFSRPLLGTGPDTFFFTFPSEAQGLFGQTYERAHNEYLQILICQGIIGISAYVVFLFGIFFKWAVNAFKNPMIMALGLAFIGYCTQAFFNISVPIISQILWVLAGIIACRQNSFVPSDF